MSAAAHTPGPWLHYDVFNGDKDAVIAMNPNRSVAKTTGQRVERKGNARLIAAAPDLLAALTSLIDMDVAYQRGPLVSAAVDIARAAIAKATGSAA